MKRETENGSKMIASKEWEHDDILKETLLKLVEQGLQRTEIISFVKRDFSQYCWSLHTLDRFDIYHQDKRERDCGIGEECS